jgi:hypothetical protein
MTGRAQLNESRSVTLATVSGVVTGTVSIGPGDVRGPANWEITGVLIKTSRPGVAPIPLAQTYKDYVSEGSSQGFTYDGSFSPGSGSCVLVRGQVFIVVWTGGQAGDLATVTLTGEKY